MSNFRRTADWLNACGKQPGGGALGVQIGCHIEEFVEFLDQLTIQDDNSLNVHRVAVASELLESVANALKSGNELVWIAPWDCERALDALCDMEVTGNGVAYLAGFDKEGADAAVLNSNDAKLVDGKPVLKEGGKIGKPPGWVAPDLSPFV